MDAIYRYPGITPFSEKDKGVFFGREADIERLYNSILLNQCTVIAGKSGIGKTSLIYAGVKPKIEREINNNKKEDRDFTMITIRVGVWMAREHQATYDTLAVKVKRFIDTKIDNPAQEFLAALPQNLKDSLWYKLKQVQFLGHQKSSRQFLLIFDQLEELFTYPFSQFKELLKEFKEIMTNNLPDAVRETIEDITYENKNAFHPAELQVAYTPLPVKLLLAIRSDKLNLLNRLREAIPSIYQNPVELRPLSREQAAKAIIEPATKKPQEEELFQFKTDPFEIEADTVNRICDFLENQPSTDLDSNFEEWRIEPFILQIICQHIERNIAPYDKDKKISSIELDEPDEIIKNYYEDALNKMGLDEQSKQNVRTLIEEDMIYEPDKRRLIVYKEMIPKEYNISEELLNKLTDAKLLRELTAAGSKSSYEISHDWLVLPILNAKKERLNLGSARKIGGGATLLEEELKKNPNDYTLYKRIGDYYYFIKDYETAISKYSQAIRKKELLGVQDAALELYMNRADSYLKIGDYASSINDLQAVLQTDPQHLLANYYVAYSYHMSKNYALAKEYYLKVLGMDPNYSNGYYNLGLVCENLQELEESYHYFLRTTELNPQDYEAYYRLGLLTATKMSKLEESVTFFNKSIELNPAFEDAYIQLAYVYYLDLAQYDNAIAILRQLIEHNPDNKKAWKALVLVYRVQKNYAEANKSALKCITLDPKDPELFFQLSALSNDEQKFKNAVSYAASCLQLNPTHVNALLEKGYAHRMLQQIEDATACFNKVLEMDPKNETALNNINVIRNYEDNEKNLLQAIQQNPSDVSSRLQLGIIYNNQKKYPQAIDQFQTLLQVDEKSTGAWLEMAYAYSRLQQYEKAIECYKTLIELEPGNAAPYWSLGKVYDYLNKPDEASYYLQKAVELDASEQDSYYRIGRIANDQKQYEKAVEAFDKALQLKPDNTNALLEKSYALFQLARYEEVINCCKTIISYDAAAAAAYYNLGKASSKLDRLEDAANYLLKAVQINPNYYEACYELGLLSHNAGDYANAIGFFEKCISIQPERAEAYGYIAYYSMQAKDFETAIIYYTKLVAMAPDKSTWQYNLGLALKEMNRLEEALPYFKKAVEINPEDADSFYYIGKIFEALHKSQEAQFYYEKAMHLKPEFESLIRHSS